MLTIKGNSMEAGKLFSGDIVLVDRSLKAKDNCVIIAITDNQMKIKRLRIIAGQYWLY